MNIYFLVRDVVIAAKDQFRIFLFELIQVSMKFIEPFVLESLALIPGGAGWEIGIDQSHIAEIQLDNPAFAITQFVTMAVFNMIGFDSGKYGYAAVSFFLCRKPVVVVTHLKKLFV